MMNDDSAQVARGQKLLIAGVLIQYVGGRLFGLFGLIPALIAILAGVLEIGRGLRLSRAAIGLYMFLMIIPLVNLLAMLRLNGKATEALRRAGYRVGLFGASR